jgi:archaellum biogenesis protein FlaJ (TadC family)
MLAQRKSSLSLKLVFSRDDSFLTFIKSFSRRTKGTSLSDSLTTINNLQYFKKLGDDLLSLNSKQLEKTISKKVLFDLEGVE